MTSIPEQIGNYIRDRQIGRGASSEVWLAHHLHLTQRKVAIKVLMSQDQDSVARFSREASIAARLHHPHIVRLYDHGLYPPFHCSIFHYVEGGSLADFVERHGRIELGHALSIFRDIAQALDYAHGLGVTHRDVSPGNILLEQSTSHALLTDFGIAREPKTTLTTVSAIMGTPGFWSPEHLESATSVTRLSDLYSLGVVLYYMLSGKLPWDDPPSPKKPLFQPPLSLRARGVDHLPNAVDRVLQTMLAIDPAKRYPTAQTALDELDRIFARHNGITEIIHGAHNGNASGEGDTAEDYRLHGDDDTLDVVEHALGPDCLRAPLVQARIRDAEWHNPVFIAAKLNDWSRQHWLRRPLLGRLARLHEATSYNLYFYQVSLLFERRAAPVTREVPDRDGKAFDLEPELDRWQVPLPPPQSFDDVTSGTEPIPGSVRVAACDRCAGKGKTLCPECGGARRIKVLRPADPPPATNALHSEQMAIHAGSAGMAAAPQEVEVLVPCPHCSGHGGFPCDHCDGVGRLVQQKAFRWERWVWRHSSHDLPTIEQHNALLDRCERLQLYKEQATNGLRPEWKLVPGLERMIERAMGEVEGDARIVLSEAVVSFVPVSEITFDIGQQDSTQPDSPRLHTLTAYGLENTIPSDWTFFNWDRAILIFGGGLLLLMTLVTIIIAFMRAG